MGAIRARRGIVVVSVALAGVLLGTPALAGEVRVGDFYLEIAKSRNSAATDYAGAEKALRAEGFRLPDLDLRKVLTEADVVRISNGLGIRLSTTRPAAPVTDRQIAAFARTFAGDLSGENKAGNPGKEHSSPPREDPQPDKGKSKGFYKSASEPI